MMQKIFLKLDGVRGESKSPRHFGEIEISAIIWGGKHQQSIGACEGTGKALLNDLTVVKQPDISSAIIWLACTTGRNFAEGILTIEKISESGGLLNSVIVKLMFILVHSITSENSPVGGGVTETVKLNCENLEVTRH